jgi:thiol-disulfide isomerase/thioredoxin
MQTLPFILQKIPAAGWYMKGIARILLLPLLAAAAVVAASAPSTPPEFSHHNARDWINSDPLTLASLKGKVVMVEFFAFECVNCVKSRPWVESLEHNDKDAGLVIIGVHTPELPEERNPDAVRNAVERLGIRYPVMIDGDASYWSALHIKYWPTYCLIGRDGLLYASVPGEMDLGDERANKVAAAIDLLLKAPAT